MRYRLKDKELQQKLDELSDGDFSKQLALNYKRICSDLEFLMQIFGSAKRRARSTR